MPLDLKKSQVDWLVCQCGNEPDAEGFYTCLPNGELVEPTLGGAWGGSLYLCERCGAIYDIDIMEQVGQKVM
jgi:hypothetical protein